MSNKTILEIDEELEDIVPEYLDSRKKEIDILQKMLASKEFEQVRAIGHNLKGSGGGFGFDYISECGFNIEQMAKKEQTVALQEWIEKLDNFLNNVEIRFVEMDEEDD
jgi:HPt (histidine-containing phosphotransfer) domain-containing protein